MSDFNNKTAVISGGAEGIGLSIARAVGKRGMNVVLGDIDEAQLAIAETSLQEEGISVLTVKMDASDLSQWENLAQQAVARFEKIHMVVNNAGVASAPGAIEDTNYSDWNWVIDVNLMGVVRGAQTMVPRIKEHGEGGWMINVASMAGMRGVPYAGAYTATKVAVVGMSEAWHDELIDDNIKVSVLCPAFVKTRIHLSHRNRQQHHLDPANSANTGADSSGNNPAASLVENGIDVNLVGQRVVEAIEADQLYIFTHPSHRAGMKMRAGAIDQAFANAGESELLKDIVDGEIASFKPRT